MKTAIRIPLESVIYLQRECRKQRCGDELSQKTIERLTKNYKQFYECFGGQIYMDGDLGGAVGSPENSYEEGRWTNWTIENVKQMLDANGLPYYDTEPETRINISI